MFTANRTSHDGGGVAVYVREHVKCTLLEKSVSPETRLQKPDYVLLELSLKGARILFACVYRPLKAGFFDEFQQALFSHSINCKFVIVAGDFNAHFGSTQTCDLRDSKAIYCMLEVSNLTRVEYGPTFHIENCDSSLDTIAVAYGQGSPF